MKKSVELLLVGIGVGSPAQLTLAGVDAINRADIVLAPDKGAEKAMLAEVRRRILATVLKNPETRIIAYPSPLRDAAATDYEAAVERWHDDIAAVWRQRIAAALPDGGRAALLVWGDPSLFDSTLRIAERLASDFDLTVEVIPGVTALQALTAAHRIPLNEIGKPVLLTTGRKLTERGWPVDADTVAVFLDGACAFRTLRGAFAIWWGAYLGMEEQILVHGELEAVSDDIIRKRAEARRRHGWIMDIYLIRRIDRPKGAKEF
ncbi:MULTISPECIES: precorrin-6A synthase (deacetylating) [Methylosinus]|uniref:Precorrin-6A synthase [deacetylating] n=1 Tax=Methylosinus trichosporium (strain ATCC 35070 / NCIMB 11131 / UNIQEM 75 / OB3b) TaxID=595536 RepID=A0A2D2CZI6_METT3|nr:MULTISPECIES: precorrin-6A synthase (deacetylating) [Methylosinus]ATQ68114.1 precorrin-6A synthase (deacetylating) [Methylosinus trichosporium OB3b]OBS53501.1 precorrin-6A synthase (deacetylating) [Methylosinus sp. 3S-1]